MLRPSPNHGTQRLPNDDDDDDDFRQGRPLNQVILMVILTEKSKIKSIASRVRSNSFY